MTRTTPPPGGPAPATPATARARRMGSPAVLALALAALEPDPDALVAGRAEQWQEQLTALEDARQALLEDRSNWLAGKPEVRIMINVIRE